jgi:hypothetical protein
MRQEGARYVCDKCKAELVYEKSCPCGPEMPHVEICCGQQMRAAETTTKKKALSSESSRAVTTGFTR